MERFVFDENLWSLELFVQDQSGLLVQLVNLCSKKKSTKYNVSSSEEKRILSVNENNDLDKDPFYKDLPETNL